jgi:hypothetical protein
MAERCDEANGRWMTTKTMTTLTKKKTTEKEIEKGSVQTNKETARFAVALGLSSVFHDFLVRLCV